MIVVSVILHSAVTGQTTELARAVIHNVGGTSTLGDYEAFACRGRDKDARVAPDWFFASIVGALCTTLLLLKTVFGG